MKFIYTIEKKVMIIVIILMCFMAHSSSGQYMIPGFKLGMNISSINSDQIESKSRIGINAGLNFTSRFGDNFDLITEFTYSQQGGKAVGRTYNHLNSSWTDVDHDIYFNSFHWAIIGNYYIKAPNLSVQAGPVIGFMNKLTEESRDGEVYFGSSDDINETLSLIEITEGVENGVDFFFAFGVSGGTEALRVNLRYNLGFKNYLKKGDYDGRGFSMKNNYLQLSVAYSLLNFRVFQ